MNSVLYNSAFLTNRIEIFMYAFYMMNKLMNMKQ